MDTEKRNTETNEAPRQDNEPPLGAGAEYAADAAEAAEADAAAQAAEDAAAQESVEELIARLEAEKSDLTDRLLRAAAEAENLRRRAARDVQDARRYAMTKFATDMLQVGDNLRRALGAVDEKAWGTEDPELKALLEGVQMTARELERILERHEVVMIPAMGERFDPHRHQAMFEVPDPSVPAGTIVQVAQDGYMIGDRVLRAALVGVAKGGPTPDKAANQAPKPEAQ
ncbi:nucleotide exchange factor GrpE [Afifella marina]|uniref:Protein GrpE n=1 Tax=Afifella marina DSM 2698 TaxID=1120955 RepID=A0A1G5NCQ3_AFIMA|nr:nucleotide exchange factor GrpE [Afifella marina]MBK1623309.1 nucleotide exchange factor GrpE [Afifella marina DSM 2698]MBK1626303.1 nucleotide exchange factor GrpE [Afifella marina]MBK5917181.1 nucleotide exchange factor GrpE [Afifella marina]RAI22154.1 nucleotide exchange factor GrpE [Afifella marina DSM 2698]SCZ35176.1 molecular chaperone GrpE [Afifella marina DSM 2698]